MAGPAAPAAAAAAAKSEIAPPPAPGPMGDPGAEGAALRAEVEQQLLRLSQDLYEMEICAGDVGVGMEGAVPAYMAKINQSFVALHRLAGEMGEGETVPRAVVEQIDTNRNPHMFTKSVLTRAVGENQYALGRMVGLESFRSQLADALATDMPQIPLPPSRRDERAPEGMGMGAAARGGGEAAAAAAAAGDHVKLERIAEGEGGAGYANGHGHGHGHGRAEQPNGA